MTDVSQYFKGGADTPSAVMADGSQSLKGGVKHAIISMTDVSQYFKGGADTPSAVMADGSQSLKGGVKHAISSMATVSQSVPQRWSQTRRQQYGKHVSSMVTVSQCHKCGVKHVISSMATVSQCHKGGVKHVISSMARWSQTRHQQYGNSQSVP